MQAPPPEPLHWPCNGSSTTTSAKAGVTVSSPKARPANPKVLTLHESFMTILYVLQNISRRLYALPMPTGHILRFQRVIDGTAPPGGSACQISRRPLEGRSAHSSVLGVPEPGQNRPPRRSPPSRREPGLGDYRCNDPRSERTIL